jgi:phage terminase Nu1 subunit (DNA packaging protein)
MPQEQSDLVDRRRLAALLGVVPLRISKWQADGLPVARRGARGRANLYDVGAVVRWRVSRNARDDAPLSLGAERARLARAQAVKVEHENAIRRGEYTRNTDVQREYADIAVSVRNRLRAIPSAVAPQIVTAAAGGPAPVAALLLARIDDALRELARGVHEVPTT